MNFASTAAAWAIGSLRPEWTRYSKRLQYQTYDVTELLRPGDNCLAATLGEGWYAGPLMLQPAMKNPALRLLLRMEIERTDGSLQTLVSGPSWQGTNDGPIRRSGIYFGETYDATKEQPGWDRPGFAAAGWRPVRTWQGGEEPLLTAQKNEPIRVVKELHPREDDRAQTGHLCLRHGAKHGRLVPVEGPRAGGHEGHAAPCRNAQRRRHDLHGQPPRRGTGQRVHAQRTRRGGLRAAFHLPRLPLRGTDRPARPAGVGRDPRPRVPFRRARRGAVRVFQRRCSTSSCGTSFGPSGRT